jgi:hypothetical protein
VYHGFPRARKPQPGNLHRQWRLNRRKLLRVPEPSWLIASLLVGSVGYVAFAYGKRQRRIPQLLLGAALFVFPYFVDELWLMLLIAALLCAAAWFAVKLGW